METPIILLYVDESSVILGFSLWHWAQESLDISLKLIFFCILILVQLLFVLPFFLGPYGGWAAH